MKMDDMIRYGLLALGIGCTAAVDAADRGGFLGAGIGRSDIDSSSGGFSFEDDDTGWKIFGGYKFNPNIAVEAFWVDLGEFSDTVLGVPVKLEVDGIGIAGVGILPLNERFSVIAKLGVWAWEADASAGPVSGDDDDSDIMLGLGGEFNFTEALSARAEWERYSADDDDADLLGVSVVFSF
jgi:OOP family OmpA-OmpF porin